MNDNKSPLSLVSMKISTYSSNHPLAQHYPGNALFDNRSDFAIDFRQSSLAVLLSFCNQRAIFSDNTAGIRRQISVCLMDTTDSCTLAATTITVNIPRDDAFGIYRIDFPFAYAEINCNHTYKICVCDGKSGETLDIRSFHVFDENQSGKHISDCFTPLLGGIYKPGKSDYYKSFQGLCPGYYSARFSLQSRFEKKPRQMPEMEVRLHFPDGLVLSRFAQLECESNDLDEYTVDIPFLLQSNNLGIGYAELICMDYPIAGFVFNSLADEIPVAWESNEMECLDEYSPEAAANRYRELINQDKDEYIDPKSSQSDEDVFEKLLDDFIGSQMEDSAEEKTEITETENEKSSISNFLKHLTGLKSVKEKLSTYEKIVRFNKMRQDNGLSIDTQPLHAMFLGSPGTGKTTVAKRMGVMLRRAGVLSKGHVVVKERSTLLGPYYSNEQTNTLSAIEEAQGGILFIDEAYQLLQPNDPRDPGKLVIEALLTALADENRRDWMLILAGYPDEMKQLFEINPGFKSRIPESNIYIFDDFTETELMEIAESHLKSNDYSLSAEAHKALSNRIAVDYAVRDKSFGNARYVRNLIQTEILPAMAVRVMTERDINSEMLSVIQASDIPTQNRLIKSSRPQIGFRV